MADDQMATGEPADRSEGAAELTDETAADGAGPDWSSWSNLWQLPTVLLSVALIVAGILVATSRAPTNDFDGAMDDVAERLALGEFDTARIQMQEVIEPNLALATDLQRGRFHALTGDLVYESQASQGTTVPKYSRMIIDEYRRAQELGLVIEPDRLERWASAALDIGDLDTAHQRLAELEALSLGNDDDYRSIAMRRNRVLRRLVELSLSRSGLALDETMAVLERYRTDAMLTADDEAWAVARQAELRLNEGRFQEAVDRLLIDSRRIETRRGRAPDERLFAELYTLLGRGYLHLGRPADARHHLMRGLNGFAGSEPARGLALLLLGQIAAGEMDLELAFERFDEVVRGFVGTSSYLPALLGRAETRARLGDHEGSVDDFNQLQQTLASGATHRHLDADTISHVLMDRHDAALARAQLDRALELAGIAAGFYEAGTVPDTILASMAAVHRQLADNLVAAAAEEPDDASSQAPELRAAAAGHYRDAAISYVEHARSVVGRPNDDEAWATSLWYAADSYDKAGEIDLAIQHAIEYVEGRPDDDPRVPETLLMLANLYRADRGLDDAVARYEEIIDRYPTTQFAYASFVPLAKTLVELDRAPEAKRLLDTVIAGQRGLLPGAVEYNDAIVALGALHHRMGDYVEAIERLAEAVDRLTESSDPGDHRIDETIFRLADSHRQRALSISDEIENDPMLSPPAKRAREMERRGHLQKALDLYADVKRRLEAVDPRELDHLRADMLRYAYLYEADSAFHLEDYDVAIVRYESASKRYRDHQASMNALVQIVNCYRRLGAEELAAAAHRRALMRLRTLPESAFDDPESVMDRAAWERWLLNTPLGIAMGGTP